MWLFFLHGVAVLSIIFILVLNDCLFVCLFFFGCVFISFLIFTISIPSSQSILVCIVYIHHVEYYFLLIINWYECQHTRTYARTHTRTHARTHARTHTHAHARTHARMHTHTHANTHTRTHTHIKTHARTQTQNIVTFVSFLPECKCGYTRF